MVVYLILFFELMMEVKFLMFVFNNIIFLFSGEFIVVLF